MVTLGGATPFITNNITPKGGVVIPISRLISMRIPNQTGSKPSILIIGMKKGIQIIMMETVSMNVPKTKMVNCMPSRIRRGWTSSPSMTLRSPRVAPVKARMLLNVFDAAMIIRTITDISTVPAKEAFSIDQFRRP